MSAYRKTTFWLGMILAVLMGYLIGWQLPLVSKVSFPTAQSSAYDKVLRALWLKEAFWTRMFLVDPANANTNLEQLLGTEETLGNSIQDYFDSNTAQEFGALLKSHASLTVAYINAVRTNNKVTAASDAWYKNGDDIVSFISRVNPQAPKDTLSKLWTGYINATQQEILLHFRGQSKDEITAFNRAGNEILLFSDTLSMAFEKQFPEKF